MVAVQETQREEQLKQYGIRWAGKRNEPCTRLCDAVGLIANAQVGAEAVQNDFDGISPWADMFLCNMDNDGKVVAKYGDPHFRQDGRVSPYAYKLPVMVAIPKFYFLAEHDGQALSAYISMQQGDGFKVHPAFLEPDGSAVDYRYIGAHLGGMETVDGLVKLKIPEGTQSGTVFRLRDRGVIKLQGRGRGDHLVKVIIKTPTGLSRKQKKMLEELGV